MISLGEAEASPSFGVKSQLSYNQKVAELDSSAFRRTFD